MRNSDLADYLDHDPFLEYPLQGSGDPSPPAGRVLEYPEPRPKDPRKADVKSDPKPATPVTPEQPKRSAKTERDKHESDVLHLVMEVFPGARWTTRDEYRRASAMRDRKGKKQYGRN